MRPTAVKLALSERHRVSSPLPMHVVSVVDVTEPRALMMERQGEFVIPSFHLAEA